MKRGRKASEDLDASDLELLDEEDESKVDEDQQRFFSILNRATPAQKERYELMHATCLYNPKDTDRFNERFENIIKNIIGVPPTEEMMVITAAAAKVYVGELIEKALDVARENNETGHVNPLQLQEARRRLRKIFKRIL